MLAAAEEGLSFARDVERSRFSQDRVLLLALVKCLEVIGEAAAKISADTRSRLLQLPWRAMVSMRNHLIHVYFDVDEETVWHTVNSDLPALIEMLNAVLPPNTKPSEES